MTSSHPIVNLGWKIKVRTSDVLSRYYKKNGKRIIKDVILGAISIVAFILIWQYASMSINEPYLPTPGLVYATFINAFTVKDSLMGVTMWQNISSSMNRFLCGFSLAIAIAIPLGLLIGSSKNIEAMARPLLETFRPIPPIAWVPLFYIALGSIWEPVLIVFLGVLFPVLSNVVFGVRSVDPQLVDAARTMGASRSDVFLKVNLPYALPYIMAGITIGVGIGWMCMVTAEMMGSVGGGVGTYILTQSNIGNWAKVFVGIIVIAILGMASIGTAKFAEKRISKWIGVSHK